jgi:hypothetical protein
VLDLAVAGSATVLPAVLDFDRDREASPARMNRAMEYLYLRLAAATALQPEFESAIAQLQAVGLDRLNEVLGPIFADAQGISAELNAIRNAWLTGAPLTTLMNELADQVTARLATADASVVARLATNLASVDARLSANADQVAAQIAASNAALAAAGAAIAGVSSRAERAFILGGF